MFCRKNVRNVACVLFVAVVLAIGLPMVASATPIVGNPGFELPVLAPPSDYYTTPFGSLATDGVPGWTFASSVAENGVYAGIGTVNAVRPYTHGNQDAFFEINGWFSQSISGWNAGDTNTVSFYAVGIYGSGSLKVKIDDVDLAFGGVYTLSPQLLGPAMTLYTSDTFAVATGSHTLKFAGTGTGLVYVDDVSVASISTPEPSTLILLVTGLIGLLAYAWRRRK